MLQDLQSGVVQVQRCNPPGSLFDCGIFREFSQAFKCAMKLIDGKSLNDWSGLPNRHGASGPVLLKIFPVLRCYWQDLLMVRQNWRAVRGVLKYSLLLQLLDLQRLAPNSREEFNPPVRTDKVE